MSIVALLNFPQGLVSKCEVLREVARILEAVIRRKSAQKFREFKTQHLLAEAIDSDKELSLFVQKRALFLRQEALAD